MKSALFLFVLLWVTGTSAAQEPPVDLAAVVGTWSEQGECDEDLYLFTPERRYFWLRNVEGEWKVAYNGIYFVRPSGADSGIVEPVQLTLGPRLETDAGLVNYGVLDSGASHLTLIEYEQVVGPDGPEGLEQTGRSLWWQRCPAE
jgi:hypothetical protein